MPLNLPGGGEQLGDSKLQCVSEVQGQGCYWKWEPQIFSSKMHLGLVFFFNVRKLQLFLNQKKWSLFLTLHKPTVQVNSLFQKIALHFQTCSQK